MFEARGGLSSRSHGDFELRLVMVELSVRLRTLFVVHLL